MVLTLSPPVGYGNLQGMNLRRHQTLSQLAFSLVAAVLLSGLGCTPIESSPTLVINQGAESTTTATVVEPTTVVESVTMPDTWNTFTSPLLRYTIEYPSTWNTWSGSERYEDMQEAESDVDYFSIQPAQDSLTIVSDQILIAIDLDTKQPLVPGEAATEDFNTIIAANSKGENVSNIQALVIDGNLPAVQQVEQDPADTAGEYGYSIVTYVDVDPVVYTIHVTAASVEDYARYAAIIERLIQSFDHQ
jgi:hypothetical protein